MSAAQYIRERGSGSNSGVMSAAQYIREGGSEGNSGVMSAAQYITENTVTVQERERTRMTGTTSEPREQGRPDAGEQFLRQRRDPTERIAVICIIANLLHTDEIPLKRIADVIVREDLYRTDMAAIRGTFNINPKWLFTDDGDAITAIRLLIAAEATKRRVSPASIGHKIVKTYLSRPSWVGGAMDDIYQLTDLIDIVTAFVEGIAGPYRYSQRRTPTRH